MKKRRISIGDLHAKVESVAPIDGISRQPDGYRIDFKDSATQSQREAAHKLLKSHDPAEEVEAELTVVDVWDEVKTLRTKVAALTALVKKESK